MSHHGIHFSSIGVMDHEQTITPSGCWPIESNLVAITTCGAFRELATLREAIVDHECNTQGSLFSKRSGAR